MYSTRTLFPSMLFGRAGLSPFGIPWTIPSARSCLYSAACVSGNSVPASRHTCATNP